MRARNRSRTSTDQQRRFSHEYGSHSVTSSSLCDDTWRTLVPSVSFVLLLSACCRSTERSVCRCSMSYVYLIFSSHTLFEPKSDPISERSSWRSSSWTKESKSSSSFLILLFVVWFLLRMARFVGFHTLRRWRVDHWLTLLPTGACEFREVAFHLRCGEVIFRSESKVACVCDRSHCLKSNLCLRSAPSSTYWNDHGGVPFVSTPLSLVILFHQESNLFAGESLVQLWLRQRPSLQ